MSREYAMSRVHDALEKSDGNHLKAQRLLISWLENDHSLLAGLVAPHMAGIISHALAHAMQPQGGKTAAPKKPDTARKIDASEATGEFSEALMSSLKGGRSAEAFGFGDATPAASTKPVKASAKHIEAMKILASGKKSTDKGDKKKH